MELKVKLTLDDYRKWVFGYYYSGLRGKILILCSAIFFACLALYILLAAQANSHIDTKSITLGFAILFLLVFLPLLMYFRLKTNFDSDKLLQEEITYVIDEKGLKTSASYGGSDLTWDKIYGAHLRKTYITINLGKNRMFLLPARFFKDKSQMQELSDLLIKVLPKGRVKGKI